MEGGQLWLGWRHYIDAVEKGWECWVYFHGPHKFENGVYAKGIVDKINLEAGEVRLRVREWRADTPITPSETNTRVAEVVATRYRQVFLWPDDWTIPPECRLQACADRQCDDCKTWKKMPLIGDGESAAPGRLHWSEYAAVVAAHWIPRRCYESRIAPEVRDLTRRFTEFKLGEMAYACPFARSMFEQLRQRDLLEFDYIVPIPLSPDKAKKGKKQRTRLLAKELGRLLAVKVREILSLSTSISKRRMRAAVCTPSQFEKAYRKALQANVLADARRILLIDDVMTRGSTLAQALHILRKQHPEVDIVVATVGQMIVKEAVKDERGFKKTIEMPTDNWLSKRYDVDNRHQTQHARKAAMGGHALPLPMASARSACQGLHWIRVHPNRRQIIIVHFGNGPTETIEMDARDTPSRTDKSRNQGMALLPVMFERHAVNRNAAKRRCATLAGRRSIKNHWQAAWLVNAIRCIDLTTLAGDDTTERVERLCAKAVHPLAEHILKGLGDGMEPVQVGAVCVYPTMVPHAVRALRDTGIKVASVATGFPAGLVPMDLRLAEIRYALGEGAEEIDIVISRELALKQDWLRLHDEISRMRMECGPAHLKVILATGDLQTLQTVYAASMTAMQAGADFIKTSTGKERINATLPVGLVMVRAIRDYCDATGFRVGFKPAGGLSSARDALIWQTLMKEELGLDWLHPDRFRIGASSLLGDIERQLDHFVTGRYADSSRHAQT